MQELHKSIYELKRASHSWNKFFDQVVKMRMNFFVYKKVQGSMVVFMILYVDNILFVGNDVGLLSLVKIWLST